MINQIQNTYNFEDNNKFTDVDLDIFSSNNIWDIITRESMKYPIKYSISIKNMLLCCKQYRVMQCPECDLKIKTLFKCHSRYCINADDIKYKIGRALQRLYSFNIKSNRFYHFTIGSNLMDKKELQKSINKAIRLMRKEINYSSGYRYKLKYIKVFDIGRRNYDKYGRYFNHFHIATMFEKIDVRDFMIMCRKVLKKIDKRLIFNNIGWRSKKAIFNYFAKRIAGVYGHKNNYYYLPNILTKDNYFEIFYRSKVVSYSFPEWLVYNIAPFGDQNLCPFCKIPLDFLYTITFNDVIIDDPP